MREVNDGLRQRVLARNGMTKTKFIYVDIDPMADARTIATPATRRAGSPSRQRTCRASGSERSSSTTAS